MWDERWARVLGDEPDVIAVYESPRGRLALLLRQTFVPLPHERPAWREQTHAVLQRVVPPLRRAGARANPLVLQHLPLPRVAHVLARWPCLYDTDPERRGELVAFVGRMVADRSFLMACAQSQPARQPRATKRSPAVPRTLSGWYRSMAMSWLGLEPPVRRDLVLCTHRWLFDRVLAGGHDALRDLRPDGALAQRLERLVPAAEQQAWARWIALALTDLDRAMRVPEDARGEAWARWLFLIPYGLPVPRAVEAGEHACGVKNR